MNDIPALPHRFKVSGMDCAACVTKIEKAVGRISGVSEVKVGMQSQTLSMNLETPEKASDVSARRLRACACSRIPTLCQLELFPFLWTGEGKPATGPNG
jgi:copper chaperone CopZ